MCGLVGMMSNGLTEKETNVFRTMLLLDVVRGEHSTGVLMEMTKDGRQGTVVAKAPGYPSRLFDQFPEIFAEKGTVKPSFNCHRTSIRLMMGHNRQATIGAKTAENAHPFVNERFIGAHNGTIKTGDTKLIKEEETIGDTDSEALFSKLNRLNGDLGGVFEDIEGDAALTYWDKEEEVLCIYRNSERPLYLLKSRAETTMLWASEDWMIKRALLRAKAEALYDLTKIEEFPINVLKKFKMKGASVTEVSSEKVELKKKTWASRGSVHHGTAYNDMYGDSYWGNNGYDWTQKGRVERNKGILALFSGAETKPIMSTPSTTGAVVVHKSAAASAETFKNQPKEKEEVREDQIPFGLDSPLGGWLSHSALREDQVVSNLRFGCAMCQTGLNLQDHQLGEVFWFDRETPVCQHCAEDFQSA